MAETKSNLKGNLRRANKSAESAQLVAYRGAVESVLAALKEFQRSSQRFEEGVTKLAASIAGANTDVTVQIQSDDLGEQIIEGLAAALSGVLKSLPQPQPPASPPAPVQLPPPAQPVSYVATIERDSRTGNMLRVRLDPAK